MAKNIVIDSGFWFALFEKRDEFHEEALVIESVLEQFNILIPWPTLYETLNTRFVKRKEYLDGFNYYLKKLNTTKIDDVQYRENAISTVINPRTGKEFSAVDFIIRNILEDTNIKTDALITFNIRDFEDICYSHGIEIISL